MGFFCSFLQLQPHRHCSSLKKLTAARLTLFGCCSDSWMPSDSSGFLSLSSCEAEDKRGRIFYRKRKRRRILYCARYNY
ncbi:hypothetical protein BS78_06G043900 [Paspalum vaginatum]|nr:hypothetical protein BS78_06G043900 [Paspalum vaginatum]